MPRKRAFVPGSPRQWTDFTGALAAMFVLDAGLAAVDWLAGLRLTLWLVFVVGDAVVLVGWLAVRRWWLTSPY